LHYDKLIDNFKGIFQKQLEDLEFGNLEYGWNNLRKIVCSVAIEILESKIKLGVNLLSLVKERRSLCKNFENDKSHNNTRKKIRKGVNVLM